MRALPLILVALLVGCGGSDGPSKPADPVILDTAQVERSIEESIATQRDLDATVICPTGVEQKKGLRFACLATYQGGQNTFTVDQADDEGNVTYEGQ